MTARIAERIVTITSRLSEPDGTFTLAHNERIIAVEIRNHLWWATIERTVMSAPKANRWGDEVSS